MQTNRLPCRLLAELPGASRRISLTRSITGLDALALREVAPIATSLSINASLKVEPCPVSTRSGLAHSLKERPLAC